MIDCARGIISDFTDIGCARIATVRMIQRRGCALNRRRPTGRQRKTAKRGYA
jgi:hypothetical protein